MGCVGLLRSVRRDRPFAVLIAAAALIAPAAQAAVIISSDATQNMSCSSGVCAPTANKAVLNVGDLENLLASGNVAVTTTGAGFQADNIHVGSALAWTNSSTLSLEAHRSIVINAALSITGLSELTLDTGKKGTFSFGNKGNVTFANLASQLTINGSAYTLVGDIKTLASDIANDPAGDFALATNYDASLDGTYGSSPVGTVFTGTFDGLGNVISNLAVDGGTEVGGELSEGLFAQIGAHGTIRDIGLSSVNFFVPAQNDVGGAGGGLAGFNFGSIESCYATGKMHVEKTRKGGSVAGGLVGYSTGIIVNSFAATSVSGKATQIGGLVGINGGTISRSYAAGPISGAFVGGLVTSNYGTIEKSYATGDVTVTADYSNYTFGGGLVGQLASGAINDSYATGAVTGTTGSDVGGLLGINDGTNSTVGSSYSTGVVTGGTGSTVGGFIGDDQSQSGSLDDTYWDTDTSGITDPSQGAGNIANDPGITGLTTAQFQSGLPAGFDPSVWAEKPNINGGLPYLLANPPPK